MKTIDHLFTAEAKAYVLNQIRKENYPGLMPSVFPVLRDGTEELSFGWYSPEKRKTKWNRILENEVVNISDSCLKIMQDKTLHLDQAKKDLVRLILRPTFLE
jgi:hypothetical protein